MKFSISNLFNDVSTYGVHNIGFINFINNFNKYIDELPTEYAEYLRLKVGALENFMESEIEIADIEKEKYNESVLRLASVIIADEIKFKKESIRVVF